MKKSIDTKVKIGGLTLKNPVMTASGTFGYGLEFEEYIDLNKPGAIIVKGLAIRPVKGNKPQRLAETPCGIINSIGLQNIGVEKFISEKLPYLEKYKTPVIANIYGVNINDYVKTGEKLSDTPVAGVEINISCPNVKKGGMQFASDKKAVASMVRRIKRVFSGAVIVKLSPNTGNIAEMAKTCEDSGADAVSLINTLTAMAVDLDKRKPVLDNVYGGLSGPAIKPIALAMVHKVSGAVKIPVIGVGGIMSHRDALEFLVAGASAVQAGTVNFRDPAAVVKIIKGIEEYMKKNKIRKIKTVIKSLKYRD